jgi:hypothetical protein
MFGGIVPVNLLLEISKCTKRGRIPNSSGIGPESRLLYKYIPLSMVRLMTVDGMLPSRWQLERLRMDSAWREPMVGGIGPETVLLLRSRLVM